jgi:hypothetical protein
MGSNKPLLSFPRVGNRGARTGSKIDRRSVNFDYSDLIGLVWKGLTWAFE